MTSIMRRLTASLPQASQATPGHERKLCSTNSVYAALPATDLERAKRFYAEKLGLTPQKRADELRYECDGSVFFVFQTSISRRGGRHRDPAQRRQGRLVHGQ
jgi:predicted enzyme related to lactoylglutathione lyase